MRSEALGVETDWGIISSMVPPANRAAAENGCCLAETAPRRIPYGHAGNDPPVDPGGRDPFFIAEVTSPSTARYDRITKRRRYQRSGVAEYWIVDPDARIVERWRPQDDRPEVLYETVLWHPPGALESLPIDLPVYFRRVWAEED